MVECSSSICLILKAVFPILAVVSALIVVFIFCPCMLIGGGLPFGCVLRLVLFVCRCVFPLLSVSMFSFSSACMLASWSKELALGTGDGVSCIFGCLAEFLGVSHSDELALLSLLLFWREDDALAWLRLGFTLCGGGIPRSSAIAFL